jgi:hypothetical protein
MNNTNPANPDPTRPLEAKQRLKTMRIDDSGVTLAAAQLVV